MVWRMPVGGGCLLGLGVREGKCGVEKWRWDFDCRRGSGGLGFVGEGAREEAREEATMALARESAVIVGVGLEIEGRAEA